MSSGTFRLGSCVVESDIALAELTEVGPDAAVDLVVLRDDVTPPSEWDREFLDADGKIGQRMARRDGGYVLALSAGVVCAIADDDSRLRVCSALPEDLLGRLLVHQALPLVLAQRGALIVHGSAAIVDGEVLAFVGASGAGKSTLASALAASGSQLIADDALWIDPVEGRYRCSGSYPGAWLTRDACDALHIPCSEAESGRKILVLREEPAAPSQSLSAIIRIAESDEAQRDAIVLEPVSAAELYFALYDNVFQLDPSHRQRATEVFERLTEIASDISGWQLKIPASFDRLGAVCDRIRRTVIPACREQGSK